MSNPDLSIVIPTYNSIDKMSETLDSLVRTMDLVDGEVVFVDDCSKDDTYDRLVDFAARFSNWKVLKLAQNSGSAAAPRNKGIENASGKWIYFLDSDDVLEPKAIEEALDVAIKYNYDVVRTSLKVRMGYGSVRVGDLIP